MPALSFKKQFVGKIMNGRKRQTIRTPRKYPIDPGDTLYLYTAQRTKYCKKLREVKCKSVQPITIHFNSMKITLPDKVIKHQYGIGTANLDAFAKADGFKNWFDMQEFWLSEHGIKKGNRKVLIKPFTGILITW